LTRLTHCPSSVAGTCSIRRMLRPLLPPKAVPQPNEQQGEAKTHQERNRVDYNSLHPEPSQPLPEYGTPGGSWRDWMLSSDLVEDNGSGSSFPIASAARAIATGDACYRYGHDRGASYSTLVVEMMRALRGHASWHFRHLLQAASACAAAQWRGVYVSRLNVRTPAQKPCYGA
jgi:hypothetical protein